MQAALDEAYAAGVLGANAMGKGLQRIDIMCTAAPARTSAAKRRR